MPKQTSSTIITALITACAMIAFAYYRAYVTVPAAAFWLAAAVICLVPVASCLVKRRTCGQSK
ncbi:MAG: hypothetical protein QM757_41085 [Paludibaculum sp.]